MQVLGLDIGGANLKAADTAGAAVTVPFEIWRAPHELPARIRELIAHFPEPAALAVTMTAELADCFASKAEGVNAVLAAVEQVARVPVDVWQTNGRFAAPDEARRNPLLVAAANWHALATWAGRLAPRGTAILLDIGSTTTDIIPLRDGVPCTLGSTDVTRLLSRELVYTGVRRTPLAALAAAVPLRDGPCPLAAELFATAIDVYVLLGMIPEDPADCGTADGRPAVVAAAHARLARMFCCDTNEFPIDEARAAAEFLAGAQREKILEALDVVLEAGEVKVSGAVISGSGEFLARQVLAEHPATRGCPVVSLSARLSPDVAAAACAYAVAILASERLSPASGNHPTAAAPGRSASSSRIDEE